METQTSRLYRANLIRGMDDRLPDEGDEVFSCIRRGASDSFRLGNSGGGQNDGMEDAEEKADRLTDESDEVKNEAFAGSLALAKCAKRLKARPALQFSLGRRVECGPSRHPYPRHFVQ